VTFSRTNFSRKLWSPNPLLTENIAANTGTSESKVLKERGWLKIWALLFCVSLLYCSKMESAEIKVESRISEVTVYPASALINRTASLKLKRGEYEIVFADIVPEVDENSLRVSASGEAKVKLFGAQLKKEYLEEVPTEKIKRLQEEIQNLEDEVKAMENLRKLLLEEKNFLDSIRLNRCLTGKFIYNRNTLFFHSSIFNLRPSSLSGSHLFLKRHPLIHRSFYF